MRRRYGRDYEPPAPFVRITVRAPGDERTLTVDAKVDTGADLCTLPQFVVTELDLPGMRVVRVLGFEGEPARVNTHLADLALGALRLELVEIVPTGRHHALLGRNALRHLVAHLDGPRGELEIEEKARRRRARHS